MSDYIYAPTTYTPPHLNRSTGLPQSTESAPDQTTASTQPDGTIPEFNEGIDWARLRGFELPPTQTKKVQGTEIPCLGAWLAHTQFQRRRGLLAMSKMSP
jgi:hypothetical protein